MSNKIEKDVHDNKENTPQKQFCKNDKSQRQPWNFPQNTLEEAIKVIQQIDEKYAGKKTRAVDIVKLVGFNKVTDWRFKNLLRSANLYGLTTGTGEKALIEPTPLSADILSPQAPAQRQSALLKAFQSVELFQKVSKHYEGKKIPEDEYFGNTLTREYNIPKDRIQTFISVFTANLNYLKVFTSDKQIASSVLKFSSEAEEQVKTDNVSENSESAPIREFLDTCFILMPYGQWHDKYFKEIYVSATKEAGFEPVRADEVFSAGSVIEQIWNQIRKSKVMLADLTGKNPNVFYELGLAHAIQKPVVLVSATIDDVPFDLRHLRTVIYDNREPNWGEKLKKEITAYLKNSRTAPETTIPQPFRDNK